MLQLADDLLPIIGICFGGVAMLGGAVKQKVFISYSRNDLVFADQLAAALESLGFDPIIDRHGISGGEEWRHRLGSLIRAADTTLFVVSPASARSEICAWEIGEAVRLSKRILPVVCEPLGEVRPPDELASLNYIFFYPDPRVPGSGFGTGLAQLKAALETDIDWIRMHTSLGERAERWLSSGRDENLLLRGEGLSSATTWIHAQPRSAPDPTDAHRAYIAASEAARIASASHGHSQEQLDAKAKELDERERLLREAEAALVARSSNPQRPAPKPRGAKIFISYRRSASQAIAGRMYDRLEKNFSADQVFFDVDAIPIGVDFKQHIKGSIEQSALLLAVIGNGWVNRDWSRGKLWTLIRPSSEDYVRSEIELALELNVPVMPILVDGAVMPRRETLPTSLMHVCDLNAASVRSGRDFHSDMNRVEEIVRDLRSQL